jgi:hypothetical protein
MKSFIMALFLLSTSLGNLMIAGVNSAMVKTLHASAIEVGEQTWVTVSEAGQFVTGTEDRFHRRERDRGLGRRQARTPPGDVSSYPRSTRGATRAADGRRRARPIKSQGEFKASAQVDTYYLVGPNYFYFFIAVMALMGVIFIFFASRYKEKTHVREATGLDHRRGTTDRAIRREICPPRIRPGDPGTISKPCDRKSAIAASLSSATVSRRIVVVRLFAHDAITWASSLRPTPVRR